MHMEKNRSNLGREIRVKSISITENSNNTKPDRVKF